jgi:hypothetical protein
MNDSIERVLRNSPKPKTPAGLAEKLKADISLPRRDVRASQSTPGFFRRWLPGFATAVLFLGCLVAIGVQARVLSELRRERQQLEANAALAQALADASNAAQERMLAERAQLDQLRKDNVELQKLRAEIAELQSNVAELTALRAQNQRLTDQLKAPRSGALVGAEAEVDPFSEQKTRAQAIQCVSNLKQVGLAARMWANDHKEFMPPDFVTMQNELNTPKILVCPGDTGRTKAASWNEFGPANVSYEFLVPGMSERESPNTIMTRCPIHGHVGLLDGSVQQSRWDRARQKDGRWVLE